MKIIAIGPLYNEGQKAVRVLQSFPADMVDEIVVVDDASTDGAIERIQREVAAPVTILRMEKRSGPGTAIRCGIDYGLSKGAEIFVILAMNGKDNPQEITRLLAPILSGDIDFVQGSRYLRGGGNLNIPFIRLMIIKMYTLFLSMLLRRKITDSTNGFRAFRAEMLNRNDINLWQDWLDGYPMETYLYIKVHSSN